MNDQEREVLKLAAERLLAVADGATLEWVSTGDMLNLPWEITAGCLGGERVRIRPPAAPTDPRPSQAVLDACKRLGVEAWKLARFFKGDKILHFGCVHNGKCSYDSYDDHHVWECDRDQDADIEALYWHVRPIGQAKPPELPCPPKPTPEQVAAARMPDGRMVKEPTVCEVPNGRAYFSISGEYIFPRAITPVEEFGRRRWIADPLEDVVTPWALDPKHAGKVEVRKDGAGFGIIANVRGNAFVLAGVDYCVTPEQLKRDWTHDGRPCGEVQP